MTRRPARFTEADLRRAMKVAQEFDMTAEIDEDGTIRIVPMDSRRPNGKDAKPLVF